MGDKEIKIRTATGADAPRLLEIYAYYVLNTAVSFEYAPPSVQEFESRILNTLNFYPYLVAEREGEILGYAYAGAFRQREAYSWNAETTVYLKATARGLGLGKMLYTALEEILKAQGMVKLIAAITEPVDSSADYNSLRFHTAMGFVPVGRFEHCGQKFGKWYTTLFMAKLIAEPVSAMTKPKSFQHVRAVFGL